MPPKKERRPKSNLFRNHTIRMTAPLKEAMMKVARMTNLSQNEVCVRAIANAISQYYENHGLEQEPMTTLAKRILRHTKPDTYLAEMLRHQLDEEEE
jgi:hypothetical protein